MAVAKQDSGSKKNTETKTQTVSVGGRDVSTKTTSTPKQTTQQKVTVGGRDVTVNAPKTEYKNKATTSSNPTVGGRQLSNRQVATDLVNQAKNNYKPVQQKTQRQQEANPYKKSYTEDDYNNLKNTLYNSAEDPYYDMMWSNVEYKDMWTPEAQKEFDDYNANLNKLGEEAQVAKGDVATQKEIKDTQGNYVIDDVVDRAKSQWRNFDDDLKTYEVELEDLVAKNQQYESLMEQLGDGEEYQKYKAQSDVMKNRIDELNGMIGDIKGKQAYQTALQKRLQFEDLRANGSKDEFLEYSKYAGSYMNNLLDDIALNYEASQFRKLAGVQTFIENVKQSFGDKEAQRITDTITKLYNNGDVTEEEKDEVLAYAQNVVDRNTTKPGESIGAQLNDIANQLSMMQENGETATEKLFVDVVGNVLDNSIGQLGPAIAFGRAGMLASTALMSMSGYTQTYQQDIEAGFTHEQAQLDALFQSGVEFLTELIGGERILRFAEGEVLPRTFGQMVVEGFKSGFAESTEEGLGWGASPIAHYMATGEVPSIESWNPEELKQAVVTAFLAGFVQAEMSADYSQLGMEAPLTATEQTLNNFLTITTDEGKNRVQDLINELNVMGRDASWRKNIFLADGTKISEKQYIDIVKKIAEKNINEYNDKIQVKGVEIINEDRVDPIMSLAEDSKYSLKDCLEVTRQEKINSLMQSLNAGEVIQTVNEQYEQDVAKKMVAQESERLAEIQKQLDKDGVKVKAPMWEQLSDEAKTNATIVSKVSDLIGSTPIEFADLRTKDGKIVDGFYDDGKIVVNPNAKLGAISTFIHEYTHGIEANKFYAELRNEVKFLYGRDYQTLVNGIKKEYSNIKKLSQEDAERELTAKTVQKMLGNKQFVERLVKYHTDMAYKMYTDLKSMTTYSTVAESMAQTFLKAFKGEETEIERKYDDAVKNGDMKKAQELVKQYAVLRGYSPEQFYHATASEGFNEFDKSKIKASETDAWYNGIWVTTDPDTSPSFRNAKKTYPLYIKYGKIAPANVVNKVIKEVRSEWRNADQSNWNNESRSVQDEVRNRLESMGYGSIVFDDKVNINVDELEKSGATEWESARGRKYRLEYDEERSKEVGEDAYLLYYWSDNQGAWMWTQEDYWGTPQEIADEINTYRHGEKTVVLFEPDQIKSSQPVEYDDNGNVIPLSERFNDNTNDIRYSYDAEQMDTEYMDAVNNGDMETAQRLVEETAKIALKDSKVVDENGNLKVMYHSTDTPNFTKFDPSFSDDAISLFYTDDPEVADTYSKIQNNGSNVDLRYLPNKINSIEEFNKFMENKEDARVRDKFVKVDDKLAEELKQDDNLSWDDIDRAKGKYIMARKRTRGDWNYFLKDVFDTEEEVLDHIKNDEYWTPFRFGNRYKLYLDIRNPLVIDGGKNTKYDADITIKIDKQGNDIARLMGGSSYTIEYSGEMSEQKRFDTIEELLDYAKKDFGLTPSEEKKILKAYNTQAEPDNDWVLEDVEIGDREVNRFEGTHWNDINFRTFSDEASKYNNFKDASDYNKMLNDNFFANFKITEDAKGNLQVYVENKNGKTVPLGRFSRQNGEANELNKLMGFIQERLYAKALNDMKSNGSDTSYIDIISEFANKLGSVVNTYTPSPGSKTRDVSKYAKENGYDGVIFKNLIDIGGWDGYGIKKMSTIAVAFDPNQAKSADPVTYDNDGNIIPLSERFNSNNDDIRYSFDEETPLGETEMSDEQMNLKSRVPNAKDLSEQNTARVLEKAPEYNKSKDAWKRAKTVLKGKTISRYAAVEELADQTKNKKLVPLLDEVMRAQGRANVGIYEGLYDKAGKKKIGKSLVEIMGKIPQQYRHAFDEYMYHWRNVDEMSMADRFAKKDLEAINKQLKELKKNETLDKKTKNKQIRELEKRKKELNKIKNRPVFGKDVTAEDSMDWISEIEQMHPEFREIAEEMWELNRQYLKMRQDSGIISEDTYNDFIEKRPHYIPIIRDVGGSGVSAVNPNDIRKFKGSTRDILPLEDAMKRHILKSYQATSQNDLNNEIIQAYGGGEKIDSDELIDLIDEGFNPAVENPDGKQIAAYKNGEKIMIPVSDEMYDALAPQKMKDSALKEVADQSVAKLSKWRKSLLTNWNPIFSIFTNPMRDIQDAFGQTKYGGARYLRNLIKAAHEVATDGELSKQYDNLGISQSQYVGKDVLEAYEKMQSDKGMKKFLNNLTGIGEAIEKIPRLAEFISSVEAGNDTQQAAYDAAEITTNFKRGGTTVKNLDKYGFPFLNASVQGFDKQVRNAKGDIQKIKDNGIKGVISVLARLTLASGIPLRLLQDWLWKDDDDYKELSDYIKSRYYIVAKTNGRFVRIPKGRVAAFWQTVIDGGYKLAKEQTDVWNMLLDDWKSFADNVAPNSVADSFIGSPLIQAHNNKSWYGEDIVPTRLQGLPDSEQYDESIDLLSIKLGELSRKVAKATKNDKFELSPYKINYVLDQYSGVLGDFALPALTLKTDVGVDNPFLKGAATAILDKFTTDPILKNQNVSTFYDLMDDLKVKSNSKYAEPEQILSYKYLSSIATEMSKLYSQKRDIQGNRELTNKEKVYETRKIQQEINVYAKAGLANYDNIDMVGKYAAVGGVQYYQSEDGSWRKTRKETLEKMNNADLSMEDRNYYYETSEKISDIRDEIKKNTPEGERADYGKQTIDAINNSKLSAKGKNTLYDSFYSGKATEHINKMNLTDEQKYDLKVAHQLAEPKKDKNGKTIANSKAEATAEAYEKLGLLNDVLKYIKDNDVAPSELGLTKTVYNKLIKGSSYQKAYSSSMKKKSSKTAKNGSSGVSGGSGIRSAGKLNKLGPVTSKSQIERKIANGSSNYIKAYQSVFNRSGKKPSTGGRGASVTCPRCGASVSASNGKCPVCGANL